MCHSMGVGALRGSEGEGGQLPVSSYAAARRLTEPRESMHRRLQLAASLASFFRVCTCMLGQQYTQWQDKQLMVDCVLVITVASRAASANFDCTPAYVSGPMLWVDACMHLLHYLSTCRAPS
jgi:hypothetical protein